MEFISMLYNLLWGDLFSIPLPGGASLGISLIVVILIPAGIYFTFKTRFLPIRLFTEMIRVSVEKQTNQHNGAISGMQALIVSTAFVEATLAQIHKQEDPLYGGFRGGPAYYIHNFFDKGKNKGHQPLAVLFALSGLLCWCGVSQVISNSVSSSFADAFHIPPIVSTVILVVIAAIVVLRKNATVKVLDVVVSVMAAFYFGITIFVIINNAALLPEVFTRIIQEAFGVMIDTLVICSCTLAV